MKIALVESKPSKNNYPTLFDNELDLDVFQLCSNKNIKKVRKSDVDIEIDPDDYKWVILVGSEALQFFTRERSITTYSGKLLEKKFLPIINPAMLAFKPEAKPLWERSKQKIFNYLNAEVTEYELTDDIVEGINEVDRAYAFMREALEYDCEYFAIDSETTSLYPKNGYVQGISLCYNGKTAAYIDSDCLEEHVMDTLQELFLKKTPVFHNAKFDMGFFAHHFNLHMPKFEDTMLLHYLIDENPGGHGLKELALRFTPYGDYEKPLKEWIDNYKKTYGIRADQFKWEYIPFEVMYPYAAGDALVTFLVYEKFKKILQNEKLKWVYYNILIPGSDFLRKVQANGVPFDLERLLSAQAAMQKEIEVDVEKLRANKYIQKFVEFKGEFNPNSVVQLRSLLFDYMGLAPTGIKTGTGENSTNKEALSLLAKESEVPELILDIRAKTKIKNTYLDKIIPVLDKDGRLRTFINIHTTTSGRLSSSGRINLQQLPRDNPIIKGCIVAPKGRKIVAIDLTTAEMYVAAKLSGDKGLQEVFKSGQNFHSMMAKQVFNLDCAAEEVVELYPAERQAVKAVSFGILYGAGPNKIADEVNIPVYKAKKIIASYFKAFPALEKWIVANQDKIEKQGYIYSALGRKRRLPNVKSTDRGIKGHAIRSGLNFLVQSVASDINLLAAIEAQKIIEKDNMDAKIFALVHDSILADVADEEVDSYVDLIEKCLAKDIGVSIPGCPIGIDIDIGQDYSMGKFEKQYAYLN
jgi:DNA polymerase I-like protein with 3'-5' exonuclease and polymerase domains